MMEDGIQQQNHYIRHTANRAINAVSVNNISQVILFG